MLSDPNDDELVFDIAGVIVQREQANRSLLLSAVRVRQAMLAPGSHLDYGTVEGDLHDALLDVVSYGVRTERDLVRARLLGEIAVQLDRTRAEV